MTEIGIILTVLFSIAVIVLPKHQAALAFIAAAMYITQGQAINIGDINMMGVRFVELSAAIRVISRKEFRNVDLGKTDILLITFFLTSIAISLVRTGELDKYAFGLAVDGNLTYFVFRALITTPEDFVNFMKRMAFLIVPFAMLMLVEGIRGQNLFSFMGGVPEISKYREGYFRAQGSFRHSITAGTLGATFFPIFISILFQKSMRGVALLGIAASLIIVIASHSSGPLMTTIIAAAAWCCWIVRRNMKWVRRGIVAAFIGLHMLMSAPSWFIFDRISGIIGGDGWHRSNIIDKFINSIGDWWLIGMSMEKTENWAATVTKFGYADITNYYVSIGINSGIVSLLLFIGMLVACLSIVGSGLQCIRTANSYRKAEEAVLWGIGSAVCAHAVNLTAVSYWDQSYVIWYFHLAIAVTLGSYCLNLKAKDDIKETAQQSISEQSV